MFYFCNIFKKIALVQKFMVHNFLQNLYKILNHEIRIPYNMVRFLFFFSLLQFISFNMDKNIWDNDEIFQSSLISFLLKLLSFTRITSILSLLSTLSIVKDVIFALIFALTFYFTALMLMISLEFEADMKRLTKARLELEWESMLHYKTNTLSVEILRKYQILLPILLPPFFEILSNPIFDFLNNQDDYKIWVIILSIIGILLLFIHMASYVFFFNQYEFNSINSLTRTISLIDILNPITKILPILVHNLIVSKGGIFIGLSLQIFFLLLLSYNFMKKHTYFDIKVMHLYGTHLFFQIMFLILLLFGVLDINIADQPIFLLISIGFLYKIAYNLTTIHFITVIQDPQCNNLRSIKDISSRISKERFDMDIIFKKFLIIYGYFYYKSPQNRDEFLEEIPTEILGFITNHILGCKTEGCPLNRDIMMQFYNIKDINSPLPIFDDIDKLKKIFKDYILFIYSQIPSLMLVNDLDFSFMYILLLLTDEPKTFTAIQQIHKFKNPHDLSFYHCYYIDHFLEIIMKSLIIFEENQKVNKEQTTKKVLTNFNTKIYMDIENTFTKMTTRMKKYQDSYAKFLESLMAEKPHLHNILKLGSHLLKLQTKIETSYSHAAKTPRFITLYFEFLQVFSEDDKEKLNALAKLHNHMIDIQMLNVREENRQAYQIFDDNLFFSENSCFMHVSGSLENLGKILKVDDNTKNAFGFQSVSAMQGQNITFIMPKIFLRKHDGFMRRFLKTGKTDFLFKEQFLFARRFNNDIFKISLTIKPFFDKNSQILKFLTHIKPSPQNPDSSMILVNEFGFIDSFGGPIKNILQELFVQNKSNFYIQVLIPQLQSLFLDSVDNYFSTKHQTYIKRKYKSRLGDNLLNNDILNLRIYDKYPNFPQPLDPFDFQGEDKAKELETVRSYLLKLGSLMKKYTSGCNIYRMECLVEDFKFEGLSFKLFNIQRIQKLYYRTAEEIKKIDSRNFQVLFILPKILLQTGLLRKLISRREKSVEFNSFSVESNQDKKHKEYKAVLELGNLKKDKKISNFELKEYLAKMENSKDVEDLYKDKYTRHALSCQFSIKYENNDNQTQFLNSPKTTKKAVFLHRRCMTSQTDKKRILKAKEKEKEKKSRKVHIPESFMPSSEKTPIKQSKNFDDEMKINFDSKNQKEKENEVILDKIKVLHEKIENIDDNGKVENDDKAKNEKYFTENKRLIYKIQTLDPMIEASIEEENANRLNQIKTHDKNKLSSNIQKDNSDQKNDLFRMINKPYVPPCYRYLQYNQITLVGITFLGFALLAYFTTQILASVEKTLIRNLFLEDFKTDLLDSLMLTQETLMFANIDDLKYAIDDGIQVSQRIYYALNPPDDELNHLMIHFYFEPNHEVAMSLLSGLYYLVDYLVESEKTNEINQIILVNTMKIFQALDGTKNMNQITSNNLNEIRTEIYVVSFLAIFLIVLLVCLQIINVFAAFSYFNSVLRLFLSLPINDYKNLLENVLKYKEFKESQENSNELSKSRTFISNDFNNSILTNKNNVKRDPGNHNKKTVRLVAIHIKVPIIFLLLLGLLFIAIFSSFIISILYESQILDSSLDNLLFRVGSISKIKSLNYQLFIRLTDKNFFNNTYGYKDSENIELFNTLQNSLNYVFDHNNYFTSSNEIMQTSLCENLKNINSEKYEECKEIAEGILTKGRLILFILFLFLLLLNNLQIGLETTFSYLLIQLNAILQDRLDIKIYENYDQIALIIQQIDSKIYDFQTANNNYIIENLTLRNTISLSTLLFLGIFLTCTLSLLYWLMIKKILRKNLIEVRLMLRLISMNLLSKSAKVRKYLVISSSKNIKKQ